MSAHNIFTHSDISNNFGLNLADISIVPLFFIEFLYAQYMTTGLSIYMPGVNLRYIYILLFSLINESLIALYNNAMQVSFLILANCHIFLYLTSFSSMLCKADSPSI
jgi:hypothetical protein